MVSLKKQFEEAKRKYKLPKASPSKDKVKEVDTGFLNTKKIRCQGCKEGVIYRYKYFDIVENKYKILSSTRLENLKKKVKDNELEWEVESYYKARKTAKEYGLPLRDLK